MNPYEILGVSKDSDQNEIKKSYRKLSLQFHPDRNNSDEAKIKMLDINDAYEKIGDTESRHEHDQQSNNPFHNINDVGHRGFGAPDDMQNIFNMIFGGGIPHGMQGGQGVHVFHGGGFPGFNQQFQKPVPIIKNILITLEQSYTGYDYSIDIERWIIMNNMKVNEQITISFKIPAGIDDNEIIIIRDCGNIMNEQMKGDLKVVVNVQNTTSFKREGLNLIYYKKISLKESLCGFSFSFKQLNGESVVLNSNKVLTVIGPKFRKIIPMMGMIKDNVTGNLIIEFDVEFPVKLTIEQVNALKEIL